MEYTMVQYFYDFTIVSMIESYEQKWSDTVTLAADNEDDAVKQAESLFKSSKYMVGYELQANGTPIVENWK